MIGKENVCVVWLAWVQGGREGMPIIESME